jgi:hyperosmotically inducible protein
MRRASRLGLLVVVILLMGVLLIALSSQRSGHLNTTMKDSSRTLERAFDKAKDEAKDLKDDAKNLKNKEGWKNTDEAADKLKKAGRKVDRYTTDASLTAAIKMKLLQEDASAAAKINVTTNNGVVTLSGSVSNVAEAEHAKKVAASQDGVRRVISTLKIERS